MSMDSRESRPADTARTTVLVIEPDIIVRMTIADYLRDCGYQVVEGAAADDALTLLEAGRKVDIILAEVVLPGILDGFGLARRVRQQYPGVDVILTAGTPGAAAKAEDLCNDGPLEKPYHPQEMLRRINLLIERRRRRSFPVD
jgi:DNA-binding response OmpR family regulator